MSYGTRTSGQILSGAWGGDKRSPKSGTGNKLVRKTPVTTANWRYVIWE